MPLLRTLNHESMLEFITQFDYLNYILFWFELLKKNMTISRFHYSKDF